MILQRLRNLTKRERIVIGGLVAFIISALGYVFVISPGLERSRLLNRLITQKEVELLELLRVQEEYNRLKAKEDEIIRQVSKGSGSISPLSHLEQLAQKAGLREQIKQMRPLSPISAPHYIITPVQLVFKGVGLRQLVSFIYEIENAKATFRIKKLQIRSTARPEGGLDVTIEVLTFSISGGRKID